MGHQAARDLLEVFLFSIILHHVWCLKIHVMFNDGLGDKEDKFYYFRYTLPHLRGSMLASLTYHVISSLLHAAHSHKKYARRHTKNMKK